MLCAFMISAIAITSCGDDTMDPNPGEDAVFGCTDPNADNFSDASNQDNGTCTYFSLFEGNYEGAFECTGLLMDIFSEANAEISFVFNPNTVSVIVTSDALPNNAIPINGNIADTETLTLNQLLPGVPIDSIPGPMGMFTGTFDITISGDLIRQGNGDLVGDVTFDLLEISDMFPPGSFNIVETCEYTAIRQ